MPAKPKDGATNSESGRVAFAGIIKSIRTAIDASGDKVGTISIAFRPEGDTVAELDKLHKPDSAVFVVVMEKPE
jgi:hypothetical protein